MVLTKLFKARDTEAPAEAPAMAELRPRICVVGIGGAGCNAVRHMIRNGLERVEFVACDTDVRVLDASPAETRILLREKTSGRLPVDPRRQSPADRALDDEIAEALAGAQMCFIAVGMGGGTGTGAALRIASWARRNNILTVAAATKPFRFEGRRRYLAAERGIEELRRAVDTMIVIPNENLLRSTGAEATVTAAFEAADAVLEQGVRSITDLIVNPGIVNLDFADVRGIMQGMGKAVLGTGEAEGADRAVTAAQSAVSNPLLDGALDGANHLIISIVGGEDMRLIEIDEAARYITGRVHPEAQIIWGSSQDPAMDGRIRVSVVATGLDSPAGKALRPRRTSSCRFRKHQAQPSAIYNQGFYFSTCRNCGEDMIRTGGDWQAVPKGLRVVWPGSAPAASVRPAGKSRDARPASPRRGTARPLAPLQLAAAGLRVLLWRGGDLLRHFHWRRAHRRRAGGVLLLPPAPATR
ncbi:cell division protein FtsZ [Sphingomonas parva]|uniref:Cell division protein FtsZ n=1 Tax=Sphingomonas parva TaxID=2555898 RepID=A0A4Y8ZM70_9SPHN|nr:cell division protein FtsZ [Sphingomonas parva]TFI57090.1 cell division protein FtsZ [Sphingomonas parva]